MKKIALLLILSTCLSAGFAQTKDPVIMNIGGKDVSKSEFEYIWNKNNTNNTPDKKSLDEYVDLFVNFKLKVAEAKAQGIDTTRAFVNELGGYRRQLITPYLTDKITEEALIQQAYDRMREYVEVSHILLSVKPGVTPDDTLKTYQKVMKIYSRAIKGEDFSKLAKENSEDGSKEVGGYLGFSAGLRYVYPFENAAYNTPVGKISKPFRSQYGYHIVKVHSRRPAPGQYRSGHILKLVSSNATAEQKLAIKDSIFRIYNAILKNKDDFKKYATEQSDDKSAASRNGEYGLMNCGSLPFEYEDAVYKLKVGEFSEPFQSKYGWHIVKALEFQPFPELDKLREDIVAAISRDERSQLAKESMIKKLKKEYNYTFFIENFDPFNKAFEAIKTSGDSTLLKTLAVSGLPLFTLNGQEFSQKLFVSYLSMKGVNSSNLTESFTTFVNDRVLAYEDSQLERKYPEFGHLMQEYTDGMLLFEVSNREVWEKASLDTVGLESFFASNKSKYAWEKPKFKGFVIQCANAKIAKQANKMLRKLSSDSIIVVLKRTFNTDSTTLIKVERGLFASGENSMVDFLAFKLGKLDKQADFPEVFVKGSVLEKGPESYTDVRGLVISDYQNYLEQKWLEALKSKFKVVVYKDVVNTVNKN